MDRTITTREKKEERKHIIIGINFIIIVSW